LIVAVLALVSVRLMTRRLGPTDYGLFVTALTFVTLAMFLTDLGVSSVAGREIAKNPEEAPHILGHNLGLRLTLSLALVPPLILLGLLLYRGSTAQLYWAIALIALAVPFQSVRSVAAGFFVASIRNYLTAAIAVLNQLAYVIALIVALYAHSGIVGCAAAYLFSTVIASAAAFFITRREVEFRPRFNARRWRAVIGQSMSIGMIQIVNLIYLKADTFLLSLMASPHAVGLYGVAYVIIGFLTLGPGLLMVSLIPLIARAEDDELESLLRRAVAFLATVGVLVACGAYLFAPAVVELLAGPKFSGAVTPVRVLGVACIFTYVNNAFGFAAFARNRHQRMLIVSLAGLVVNVASNIAVIPRFGIDGAAWATVGSELVTLVGVYVVFRRDVGVRVSLVAPLVRPLVVGLVLCAVAQRFLSSGSRQGLEVLAYVPVVAIVYFGLLALLRGLPEDVVTGLRRISFR
jgi:O-antigen/teichoic acid export membrane protein